MWHGNPGWIKKTVCSNISSLDSFSEEDITVALLENTVFLILHGFPCHLYTYPTSTQHRSLFLPYSDILLFVFALVIIELHRTKIKTEMDKIIK